MYSAINRLSSCVYIKQNYKNIFDSVKSDLNYRHFAFFGEFESRKREVLQKWAADKSLDEFSTYFQAQWLTGKFWKWQIFHTPPGFATTPKPLFYTIEMI
jgi:hypothetical protein